MCLQLVRAVVFAAAVLACRIVQADSLYGKCVHSDGSKAGSEVSISTSWNGKKAYPVNGRYVLDFGGTVDHNVTVYVNGSTFGRIHVSGITHLDVVVP